MDQNKGIKKLLGFVFLVGLLVLAVKAFRPPDEAGPLLSRYPDTRFGYVRVRSDKAGWSSSEILAVSSEISFFLRSQPEILGVVSPQDARYFLSPEYFYLSALEPAPKFSEDEKRQLRAEVWKRTRFREGPGEFRIQFEVKQRTSTLRRKIDSFLPALLSRYPGVEASLEGLEVVRLPARTRILFAVLVLLSGAWAAMDLGQRTRKKKKRVRPLPAKPLLAALAVAVWVVVLIPGPEPQPGSAVQVLLKPKYWDVLDADNMAAIHATVERISSVPGVERVASLSELSEEVLSELAIRRPGKAEKLRKTVLTTLEDAGALADLETPRMREVRAIVLLRPGASREVALQGLREVARVSDVGVEVVRNDSPRKR